MYHRIDVQEAAIETWNECRSFLAQRRLEAEGNGIDAMLDWIDMAGSLYENLTHIMLTVTEHDGPVEIWPDGAKEQLSFFWRHPASGYHGGLIFHPSYKDGERQKYGRWSIHT
jgi:hypothetical protein